MTFRYVPLWVKKGCHDVQYDSDGHEIKPAATIQECSGNVYRCNRG